MRVSEIRPTAAPIRPCVCIMICSVIHGAGRKIFPPAATSGTASSYPVPAHQALRNLFGVLFRCCPRRGTSRPAGIFRRPPSGFAALMTPDKWDLPENSTAIHSFTWSCLGLKLKLWFLSHTHTNTPPPPLSLPHSLSHTHSLPL